MDHFWKPQRSRFLRFLELKVFLIIRIYKWINTEIFNTWRKMTGSGSYPYTQDMLDSTKSDPDFMNTIITGEETQNLSFYLHWKFDESTKHYLTQMLLAIIWRYSQEGKNSSMCMKVQGRLMQARFIEIHQVFTKKEKCLILFQLTMSLMG